MEKITTLIADGAGDVGSILKSQLSKNNCEVIKEVSDSQEILAAIQKTSPDLVFLNADMSGINGLEILREITNKGIHSKVWVIAADDDENAILLAREYGAKGVISKPFTSVKVQETIDVYRQISNKNKKFNSNRVVTKVSLADDEELMRDYLENILVDCKCIVEEKFDSGNKLIEAISGGRVAEMTFLDIEMPEGNGLDALKYIQENNVPTFTVMVSGHGTFKNVKVAIDSGANGFIVKPFSRKKVELMIKKYRKSRLFN